MSVTVEAAIVYRGGGRRWFSKAAAINAEAKAAYLAATKRNDRCECDTLHWAGNEFDSPCKYHDHSNPVFGRYIRYAKHCISRSST